MADNVTGIVLDIPADVLNNIKNADKAIKDLEKTSRQAADNIKKDFGTTMVSGVEAFIRKVQEAQGRLNNLTMPSVGAKKLNLGDIGAGATKSASDISTLVQSLSQLTAALEKNKGVRAANKNVASQETEYARVSAELAKQAERYTQLSLAIEQFNQKKRDETSLKERQTNASNIQELQALQQTIPLLRQKVELMERNMRAAQTANNPTLQTRKAQEELAQMNKMYAEEEKASAKKAAQLEKDRQREAEAARKSYEQQQKMYEKLFGKGGLADKQIQQSLSQQKATTLASPTGAMDYAKNAKSLRDLQSAYKNLKAVMATVDPKSSAWQQMNAVLGQTRTRIDEIKKSMGEFKSQASQVGDVAGQLKRTLAAAFSISAITGYINKLIETRAQFELQQTALRAILQDKQKADQIFQQVQQMALQSPFSIMQMTTFTKQLAAYRIESEKLVGTTKMLADVSAGLGVDMGRLILAYGQVKAANYLRATEVRQFTEAGLNIAGELATYFSELQGKMISVGDVMEMIAKRMVRFEDVEEVFKRVTSAGGLFYDMQRKQSETLWGQLQRIKDAMSIMFNEIGKSNQSAISGILQLIRGLLNNWRVIANLLNGASFALVAYAAKTTMAAIATGTFNTSQKGLVAVLAKSKAALLSFTKFLSANPYILAITGIVALGGALLDYRKKVNATKEAYDEMIVTLTGKSEKIESLASKVADANKKIESSQQAMRNNKVGTDEYTAAVETNKQALVEQNRALQELRTNFPEVYRQVVQDKDGIVDMTTALNNFNEAVRMQTVITTLQSDSGGWFNDDFAEDMKKMSESQAKYDAQMAKATASLNAYFAKAEAIYATQKATGELSEEDALRFERIIALKNSQLSVEEKIRAIVSTGHRFEDNFISDLIQDVINLDLAYKRIGTGKKAYISKALREDTEEAKKEVDNLLQDVLTSAGVTSTEMFAKLPEATKKQTAIALNGFITDLGLSLDEAQKKLLMANLFIPLKITPAWEQGEVSQQLSFLQDKINKYIDKNKIGSFVAKTTATDNTDQYFKTLIQQYRAGVAEMQQLENAKTDIVVQGNKKRIAELKKEQAERVKLFEEFGVDYLTKAEKRGPRSRQKDIWTPRLNLMQKVNKEYEKLLKYYSKEEAMARIRTSYGDAVAEAFKGTQWADISKWGGFDAQATIERLKQLATKAGKEAKKKILEAVGTLQAELDIKIEEKNIQAAKDKIQSLFDNYELTKTLGGLGLNIDLTYLVGGKPVKLEDLRKQLEAELSTVKATGGEEDTVKAYEDALRKVTDMENKAAVERLKNYKKYLAMMYSDRAKAMIESYTTMKNMERDFADYRAKLEKEASDPATSEQRKKEISQQISMLETQARDAIKGVKNDLNSSLNKLDWEAFKGSPVFTQMYSDLETLSKKGIDLLISKLTTMRDKLQAMDNVDYRAVREITKYIEKLNTQRIEVDSWKELNAAIKEANALRKEGNNMDKAQSELMSEQANLDAANAEIANLQTIINLKQQEGTEKSKTKNLSADQLKLYDLSEDKLQEMLSTEQDNANAVQANMLKWSGVVSTLQKGKKALEEQLKRIKMLHDDFGKVYDSAIDLADALGADTEIWGDFAKGVGDSIFQVIELTIQLKLMGIAANSALGVIGYIAIALQVVASLLASIFRAGDKRKEKQIQRLQYKVEDLQKAYEKLQTAIEEAYAFDDYNAGYNQSMRNLQEQRDAIEEQMRLEEAKKKTDKEKIREYEDALDELKEKEKELRESRYEAMGSVGEKGIRTEAENFVSAWLDAYKETGDGLDALKEHWNEFFENLVLKQAASAVVSRRMKKYVDQINAAIDSGDTGLSLSQAFAQIGQNLKSELGAWNEDLKAFFDAVGIKGGQGELLLSDLQKGIQNITEPQAAAIEAYLNSMRFAVFEQNNILTEMLSAIQAQYGSNDNSPMLQEVRAIRSLVASIDDRLSRVIVQRSSVNTGYAVVVK